MQLPALLTADWHLTSNPATEYRWALIDWLNSQIKRHGVKTLLILGDLTDNKDGHSAELVNRIVTSIKSLKVESIKILTGNHDWLKRGHEFFRFLELLPNVEFITKPCEDQDHTGPSTYYLPYSKDPLKNWKGLSFDCYDYVFMHQTVSGAIASNGNAMEGEELPDLSKAGTVWSGDIHVPQRIGPVTYVGSPYHVHFGDSFIPRCVLLDRKGQETNLYFKSIKRVVVKVTSLRQLKRMGFEAGDQVKLRVDLDEEDSHAWSRIRREALAFLDDQEVVVHGIELNVVKSTNRLGVGDRQGRVVLSDPESIYAFVERESLGASALDAALDVIEGKER